MVGRQRKLIHRRGPESREAAPRTAEPRISSALSLLSLHSEVPLFMVVDFKKLKKLKGRSPQELRVRAKQEWAKLSERFLYSGRVEMSDAGLLRELRPSD